MKNLVKLIKPMLLGSTIGTGVGAIPGAGIGCTGNVGSDMAQDTGLSQRPGMNGVTERDRLRRSGRPRVVRRHDERCHLSGGRRSCFVGDIHLMIGGLAGCDYGKTRCRYQVPEAGLCANLE